jgi:hypothetical protein
MSSFTGQTYTSAYIESEIHAAVEQSRFTYETVDLSSRRGWFDDDVIDYTYTNKLIDVRIEADEGSDICRISFSRASVVFAVEYVRVDSVEIRETIDETLRYVSVSN